MARNQQEEREVLVGLEVPRYLEGLSRFKVFPNGRCRTAMFWEGWATSIKEAIKYAQRDIFNPVSIRAVPMTFPEDDPNMVITNLNVENMKMEVRNGKIQFTGKGFKLGG